MRARWGLLPVLVLLSACPQRVHRSLVSPGQVASLDRRAPYLKAHLKDGSLLVLSKWAVSVDGQRVSGQGSRFDPARLPIGNGTQEVAVRDVALFETNVVSVAGTVAPLAIMTGVTGTIAAICAANPKSCFGSCPTFYASDGEREVLMAEGFSGSVAPSLEATDVDALFEARPGSRELSLRMTNEALETHVVKLVHVLAVPRAPGGRVFAAPHGDFWQTGRLAPPVRCRAAEGDCLGAVLAFDHRERASSTDPEDLAARETLELEFDAPEGSGQLGIVVGARQTLVTTYLFYQFLAYLGREAVAFLASLERAPALVAHARELDRLVGGIEVLDSGVPVGEVGETGPIASDVKVVPLSGAARAGERTRIVLRLARGMWRLDWVALTRLAGRATPVRLAPDDVTGPRGARAFPLVTLPGDEVRMRFALPAGPHELFLESRGYYLEWMREAWLLEEDLPRAARMLADPRAALRELAPAFKRLEATMDQVFWRSRYAR